MIYITLYIVSYLIVTYIFITVTNLTEIRLDYNLNPELRKLTDRSVKNHKVLSTSWIKERQLIKQMANFYSEDDKIINHAVKRMIKKFKKLKK